MKQADDKREATDRNVHDGRSGPGAGAPQPGRVYREAQLAQSIENEIRAIEFDEQALREKKEVFLAALNVLRPGVPRIMMDFSGGDVAEAVTETVTGSDVPSLCTCDRLCRSTCN